jgi:hypothetical protein
MSQRSVVQALQLYKALLVCFFTGATLRGERLEL